MAFHRFSLQTFSLVLDVCSECGGWLGPFDGTATGEQCGAAQVVDPGDWGPEAVQPLNFQQPRSCKSLSNVWMWRLGSYCPEIRAKRWRFDLWQLCISIRNASTTEFCRGERPKAGPEPQKICPSFCWCFDPDPKDGDVKDMSRTCFKLHGTSSVSGKGWPPKWWHHSDLRSGVAEDAEQSAAIGTVSQISMTPGMNLLPLKLCSPKGQDSTDLTAWVCNSGTTSSHGWSLGVAKNLVEGFQPQLIMTDTVKPQLGMNTILHSSKDPLVIWCHLWVNHPLQYTYDISSWGWFATQSSCWLYALIAG